MQISAWNFSLGLKKHSHSSVKLKQFLGGVTCLKELLYGFHPRSINSNGNWNTTSVLSLINLPILAYSNEIRTPVLMIHGEKAHSRYFSEDAFKKLKGNNKELLIIDGANHVDLYDNREKIPFAKIIEFFKTSLQL